MRLEPDVHGCCEAVLQHTPKRKVVLEHLQQQLAQPLVALTRRSEVRAPSPVIVVETANLALRIRPPPPLPSPSSSLRSRFWPPPPPTARARTSSVAPGDSISTTSAFFVLR